MNELINDMKDRALQVHESICMYVQRAQEDIYCIGRALNEMNEGKLYTALGFEKFEDYTLENFNLKKSQAYKYISIYKNLGETFLSENPRLGTGGAYLLSQLTDDERQEITERIDISEATVNELKAEIEKMKKENEKLQLTLFDTEEDRKKADEKIAELESNSDDIKRLKGLLKTLEDENIELNKKLKETEEKAVDVAVAEPDPKEIEKRAEEIADKRIAEQRKLMEEKAERQNKANEAITQSYENQLEEKNKEIERMKKEYDERISNIMSAVVPHEEKPAPETASSFKDQFKVYIMNTVSIINNTIDFIGKSEAEDKKFYYTKMKDTLNKIIKGIEANEQ